MTPKIKFKMIPWRFQVWTMKIHEARRRRLLLRAIFDARGDHEATTKLVGEAHSAGCSYADMAEAGGLAVATAKHLAHLAQSAAVKEQAQ